MNIRTLRQKMQAAMASIPDPKARYAFGTARGSVISNGMLVLFFIYLGFATQTWQTLVLAGSIVLAVVLEVIAMRAVQRGRVELAMQLIIAAPFLIGVVGVAFYANIGSILALIVFGLNLPRITRGAA